VPASTHWRETGNPGNSNLNKREYHQSNTQLHCLSNRIAAVRKEGNPKYTNLCFNELLTLHPPLYCPTRHSCGCCYAEGRGCLVPHRWFLNPAHHSLLSIYDWKRRIAEPIRVCVQKHLAVRHSAMPHQRWDVPTTARTFLLFR